VNSRTAQQLEAVGPLLLRAGGLPLVRSILWVLSGAGWAWLGAALWRHLDPTSSRNGAAAES
jgi:hypothetical protein